MENTIIAEGVGAGLYFILLAYLLYRIINKSGVEPTFRENTIGVGKFPLWVITATLIGTVLGPADTLALSFNGFVYGYAWLIFPLGAALQHITTGLLFAEKLQKLSLHSFTLGDIFEKSYGRIGRPIVGTIVFIQAVAFAGVLVLAGSQILEYFFKVPQIYGMLMTSVFVGAYTAYGGITAVVETDKYQAILILILGLLGLLVTIIALIESNILSIVPHLWKPIDNIFGLKSILAIFSAYFLGEALLPFYAQRAMMASTAKHAKYAFVYTGIGIGLWYSLMITIGVVAHSVSNISSDSEIMFVSMIDIVLSGNTLIHSIAMMIVVLGLMSLVHSTFDSVLQNGATTFVKDIVRSVVEISDFESNKLSKQVIFAIAVLGIITASLGNNLISILLLGYTIWVPTCVVPLVAAILTNNQRFESGVLVFSLIAGVLGFVLFEYYYDTIFPGILMGFIFNLITFYSLSNIIFKRKHVA